jgi:hypothetical protein
MSNSTHVQCDRKCVQVFISAKIGKLNLYRKLTNKCGALPHIRSQECAGSITVWPTVTFGQNVRMASFTGSSVITKTLVITIWKLWRHDKHVFSKARVHNSPIFFVRLQPEQQIYRPETKYCIWQHFRNRNKYSSIITNQQMHQIYLLFKTSFNNSP